MSGENEPATAAVEERERERERDRDRRESLDKEKDRFKPRHMGDTALHAACGGGNFEVVEVLLQHEANVNSTSNSDGSTPLMRACEGMDGVDRSRLIECVKLLLASPRLDLHQANFAGRNALHVALDNRMLEAADMLLDAGAKACENAGRRCTRCMLGIKSRERARIKAPPAPVQKENTELVLQEEFGDGDFLSALSLAKAEICSATGASSPSGAASTRASSGSSSTRRGGKKKGKKKATPEGCADVD